MVSGSDAVAPTGKNKTAARRAALNMATSTELPVNSTTTSARTTRADTTLDEIAQLKHQLLQAEIRLAKSRANAAGAEADVKVLTARLRAVSSR